MPIQILLFHKGSFLMLLLSFKPCQHAGGASFVATVMDGLLPPASAGKVAPVILDLMGYDAAAATYTVNKVAAGLGWLYFPKLYVYSSE